LQVAAMFQRIAAVVEKKSQIGLYYKSQEALGMAIVYVVAYATPS